MKLWKNLMLIAGAVSLLYYVVTTAYAGTRTAFANFWLAVGVLGLGGGLLLRSLLRRGVTWPAWAEWISYGILAVGLLVFFSIEVLIIHTSLQKPEPDADYVIVLGAQVRGTRITKSLRYRLDIALEYLEENPSAKVIVSGGQGSGEDISEAAAMKGYLIERGLEAERILLEDRSVNTAENIRFSKELIEADGGSEEASVVVATNSFHVFRALRIAAKQGLTQVSGLSARNDQILMASYYVRECLAIIKDFLWGNI